jgi:DNA-binding beta-propeller fold protein YncE
LRGGGVFVSVPTTLRCAGDHEMAITTATRTPTRRSRPARLLVLLVAAVPLLRPGPAAALTVYGSPHVVPGAGGCLRDPRQEPVSDQDCPGAALGLTRAQAVDVTADGRSVYVAAEGGVAALARNRATGALRPALSPSARACIAAGAHSRCATNDGALSGADALATSPDDRFVYVGAVNAATVSAFRRARHGVLVPLAHSVRGPARGKRHDSSPYFGCVSGVTLARTSQPRCGAHINGLNGIAALVVSPDGRSLYAVSYGLAPGEDSVITLQRDPRTGGLRPLPGKRSCVQSLPGRGCPPLAGLEGATAITISPDGGFVYVASELSGAVRGFLRNRSTGALTPLYGRGGCISSGRRAASDARCAATIPQLAGARSLALSPDGRELYVAAFDPGAVVVLRRNPRSGRLAAGPPNCLQAAPDASCPLGLPFLHGASALAMGAHARVLYVISVGGNSLVELLRNPADGALSLRSNSPTALGPLTGPVALALSPQGHSIYLASSLDNAVAGFTS